MRSSSSIRRGAPIAAIAICSLLLTACGDDAPASGGSSGPASVAATGSADGGSPGSGGASSEAPPATPFEKSEASKFLLTPAEVGSEYVAVPEADLKKALEAQPAQPTDAKIEPAECQDLYDAQAGLAARVAQANDTTALTVLTAASTGGLISQAITESTGAANFDDDFLDSCSSFTLTTAGVTSKVDITELDIPDLGDESYGLAVTTSGEVSGQSITVKTALVNIEQNGKTMVVSVASLKPGGGDDVNAKAIDAATKAYDKAEDYLAN